MSRIFNLLFLLTYFFNAHAQSFQWINSNPLNYNLNPTYMEFTLDYDHLNDRVVYSRLDSFSMTYDQTVLGKYIVEYLDTNGVMLWQFMLGQNACVKKLITDHAGNTIISGQFQQTLHINNVDSINYINIPFSSINFFLIKIDNQGNLLWKRNMSATWPDFDEVETLAVDPFMNCWYGITDFTFTKIVRIDGNGNDDLTHTIINGKTLGNISFDPTGGLYVSGGAESGSFVMNTDSFYAPNSYNMYIARFTSQGQPAWAYFGNDITFQEPMIITDPDGNVFFAAMRFDSTSFNGFTIPPPNAFGDFFAFKADTAGNVLWALHQPVSSTGLTGTFTTGKNLHIDSDGQGNFYMGGIQKGLVDWGNGYTSNTSSFSINKTAIARINPNGNTEWVKMGGSSGTNHFHALSVSENGSCYFTGSFHDTAVYDNIVIPTTNFINSMIGKISLLPTALTETFDLMNQLIYPNPAYDELVIPLQFNNFNISVYDLSGREVLKSEAIRSGNLDIRTLKSGCYIIRFTDDKEFVVGKFIKP